VAFFREEPVARIQNLANCQISPSHHLRTLATLSAVNRPHNPSIKTSAPAMLGNSHYSAVRPHQHPANIAAQLADFGFCDWF
jgi:hypothetical protein